MFKDELRANLAKAFSPYMALATALILLCANLQAENAHPNDSIRTSTQSQIWSSSLYHSNAADGCCTVIAHAGGAVDGNPYTNSVEAVERNYAAGVRLFEIDFLQTSDGHWVATHDWPRWKRMTAYEGSTPPTLEVFRNTETPAVKRNWSIPAQYKSITMPWLQSFLKRHPDAAIVTDLKNLKQLPKFVDSILQTSQRNQFIFQTYSIKDIDMVLGKDANAKIILTLYRIGRTRIPINEIIERRENLYGITLPVGWAAEPGTLTSLLQTRVPIYLHGSPYNINSRALHLDFAEKGVSGFYLD